MMVREISSIKAIRLDYIGDPQVPQREASGIAIRDNRSTRQR